MTRPSPPRASRDRGKAVLHHSDCAGIPTATDHASPAAGHAIGPRVARFSPVTLEVASIFGLDLDGLHDARSAFKRALQDRAAALADRLSPASIALLTGPSGSGKSTLLRAIVERLSRRGATIIDAATIELDESEYVIDVIGSAGDAAERCALLARVGLAEARLLVAPIRRLSEGQRARLRVATAFNMARTALHASKPGEGSDPFIVIVIDEFLAPLDRITACCVARSVSRLTRASTCSLLVATAHDDLAPALKPDHCVRLELT